jgi:hypothetical protein
MDSKRETEIRKLAYALARALRKSGHQEDAKDLRELADDWRNVVAAHQPGHEDYADPDWREDVLTDWREEAQQDDLAGLVAWYTEYLATCPDCPQHAEWPR